MPSAAQLSLLDEPARSLPEGFEYRPALVTPEEEGELIGQFQMLDFKPFEFHGYFGNRRVVSFGWHYDFAASQVRRVADLPDFLVPLQYRAALFAGIDPAALEHALVTEYSPGAGPPSVGCGKNVNVGRLASSATLGSSISTVLMNI